MQDKHRMEFETFSPEETLELGRKFGREAQPGDCLLYTSYEKKDKPSVPNKGTKIKDNDGSTYIVTSGKGKTPTVQ